jgi:predicted nucleotidyltransferase
MSSHLSIDRAAVSEFCERHHITRLALFGSVIRDDFRPESDIDVLVEFQPGIRVGLAFIRMQDELSAVLGRTVDLHTPASLSKYFRDQVLREAEPLYVAA